MIGFLFKAFIVIYIIYRLSRYLAKTYFMSYMGKQMNEQAQRNYQQQQNQQRRQDGSINIDYIPTPKAESKKPKPSSKSSNDDYVDYVEIK